MNTSILRNILQATATSPALADTFLEPIAETVTLFEINTQVRLGFWLPQAAHESKGFSDLAENMFYSTAGRITQVFGARVTLTQANKLVKNPQALANHVYGKREGNTLPDDGWNFRGSGLFGLTFRNNFVAIMAAIRKVLPSFPDIVASPDLVRTDPRIATLTAGAFWHINGLNAVADRGDFTAVTRRINPALMGLRERQDKLAKILPVCGELFTFKP